MYSIRALTYGSIGQCPLYIMDSESASIPRSGNKDARVASPSYVLNNMALHRYQMTLKVVRDAVY
jgi:hypothetical protein